MLAEKLQVYKGWFSTFSSLVPVLPDISYKCERWMAWQVLAVQKRAEVTPGAGQGAGETLQKGNVEHGNFLNSDENIAYQPELHKTVHLQTQLSSDILQA